MDQEHLMRVINREIRVIHGLNREKKWVAKRILDLPLEITLEQDRRHLDFFKAEEARINLELRIRHKNLAVLYRDLKQE
jgi:hypothetical protein